jgi:hypothetical protein
LGVFGSFALQVLDNANNSAFVFVLGSFSLRFDFHLDAQRIAALEALRPFRDLSKEFFVENIRVKRPGPLRKAPLVAPTERGRNEFKYRGGADRAFC